MCWVKGIKHHKSRFYQPSASLIPLHGSDDNRKDTSKSVCNNVELDEWKEKNSEDDEKMPIANGETNPVLYVD